MGRQLLLALVSHGKKIAQPPITDKIPVIITDTKYIKHVSVQRNGRNGGGVHTWKDRFGSMAS